MMIYGQLPNDESASWPQIKNCNYLHNTLVDLAQNVLRGTVWYEWLITAKSKLSLRVAHCHPFDRIGYLTVS